MNITIDTSQPLSEQDSSILSILLGTALAAEVIPASSDEAPGYPGETKNEVQERVSEAPPADEVPEQNGVAMDLAIQRATTLVSEGKADVVKAALETAGASRVSELTDDAVPTFLEALDD